MKWEEKRYTPQELQRMQQEAVERVRQMQRRRGYPRKRITNLRSSGGRWT